MNKSELSRAFIYAACYSIFNWLTSEEFEDKFSAYCMGGEL